MIRVFLIFSCLLLLQYVSATVYPTATPQCDDYHKLMMQYKNPSDHLIRKWTSDRNKYQRLYQNYKKKYLACIHEIRESLVNPVDLEHTQHETTEAIPHICQELKESRDIAYAKLYNLYLPQSDWIQQRESYEAIQEQFMICLENSFPDTTQTRVLEIVSHIARSIIIQIHSLGR